MAQAIRKSGRFKPLRSVAAPRPEGYHPELRGGGYYYLDERPRRIYDAQGNPAVDNQGEPVIADEGFSLIALSSDPDFPEAGHAHPGTSVSCEIVSVTGPPSASSGFWDAGVSYYSDTPTFVMPTNRPTGNPRFVISEGGDNYQTKPSITISNISSDFGWAAATDANFGDSHRTRAFRFNLASPGTVTLTIQGGVGFLLKRNESRDRITLRQAPRAWR